MQQKNFLEFRWCWEMAKAGSAREGAVYCMEMCDGEMVAAPPEDAESSLRANIKLWRGNGQSRELCIGLMVVLVWVMHP